MTLKQTSSYRSRALIDLSACRHNLAQAKLAAPDSLCMAIIKANAYGHGMENIAYALNKADAFGVATVYEGVQLREAGITKTIVLLEGFSSKDELNLIRGYRLQCVVHHESQVKILEHDNGNAIPVWLKIDTGMHRLGFSINTAGDIFNRLQKCSAVSQPIRLMTHLANADDKHDDKTIKQIEDFDRSVAELVTGETEISIANSAGILGWPQSHANWNRPGILLYGVSPFINTSAKDHNLKPVMTLSSRIISINSHSQGEAIGYGGSYTCEKDMTIGVVAIGYGDGYPRHAKTGTPVWVNNQRTRLLGRVSMDMICIDLTEHNTIQVGDPVELWGKNLPVEEIAKNSDTIGYELLCGVTQRVEFVYHD